MASSPPNFPPVRACLFDMDGLLINSEDLYTLVTNLVLARYGRPPLPWSIKAQLQGRPRHEANKIFHNWANLPISVDEYTAEQDALQKQYFPNCAPLPGAADLLTGLQRARVHIALATSSHAGNFVRKTDHLQTFMAPFSSTRRVLGDDPRIPRGRGKPAPDIYYVALETINAELRAKGETPVRPDECLVFEDSVPGVESGRRAGMRVVWCPHPELLKEFRGQEAEVLAGLVDGGGELPTTVAGDGNPASAPGLVGWPGRPGDGWGELLHTLEAFDYSKYGIEVPAAAPA